jgi:hypothetical protein
MHIILAVLFKERMSANLTCVGAIVLAVFLSLISFGGFCSLLNNIMMLA